MGTLQQQSILKGLRTGNDKEKNLVHELFSRAATKAHSNQTAIYYEGKIFGFSTENNENRIERRIEGSRIYKNIILVKFI